MALENWQSIWKKSSLFLPFRFSEIIFTTMLMTSLIVIPKREEHVERVTGVTSDASDVSTRGRKILQGEVNMVQGTYLHITIRL